MDEDYYKQCTVHIRTKKIHDCLPSRLHLQQFLRPFGSVSALHEWCFRDGKIQNDKPNNVLVLFENQRIASSLLKASANEGPASFWITHSVIAFPVQGPCHRIFSKEIAPKIEDLGSGGNEERRSGEIGHSTKRQHYGETPQTSGSLPRIIDTRPAKRPRNENTEIGVDQRNGASTSRLVTATSTPQYSRTPSVIPESTEWLHARITQLESELESTRAARDLAVSEQHVAAISHHAEQQARREAMAQKSSAEAAKSRAEAEQSRLLSELERIASRQPTLLMEENGSGGSSKPRTELLEQELGEIRDRENKHHLQKSHLELQLEKAKAEIGELKSDLASTQEKLDSTQSSLELLERKYSSARRKYGASKEKLGAYKTRLENERSIVKKLQDTLTPAAYKSLGATHETLGEFLSAMGLPSLDGGTSSLKEESD
ncbi:hypothetical protein RSOLAG1IB_01026 [Rhizoctonia solani AG-1 IB]|uniref:Uncharacterized protein n=3 Tax=Rhizoctonia solani TaxID=456999 RepID=A0A0B7F4K9_THACB|nr:hypothetical protein RSOLAG1IB_01026 [Rhizoctonia solani AG-1 IB]